MKSIPPASNLRARVRPLALGAIWAVLFAVVIAVWLTIKPGGATAFVTGEDVLRILGPLVVLPLALRGSELPWRHRPPPDSPDRIGALRQWLPLVLAASVVTYLIGRGVSTFYEVGLHRTAPIPSVADVWYLAAYSCIMVAILLLPSSSFSLAARARILLDTLLVVIGVAAFSWYFVIGPAVLQEHSSTPARLINGAYPLWGFALICCLLLLTALTHEAAFRRVATILGVALIVLVGGDGLREYEILHGAYAVGTSLDMAHPLAFILLGLAAIASRAADGEPSISRNETGNPILPERNIVPRVWRYLLPYSTVPAVVALMIYAARTAGDAHLAIPVYAAGGLLIELVLLHQYLDYRELISFSSRNARLESLAAADPVTGLPNHRRIVSGLDLEFVRARRYRHPCAVLFLDLDHFKALNDSYGHPAGDAALREFASVVRTALRGVDLLGRWGGEEFVAVLPETASEDAEAVAERVRTAVAHHTFWAAGGAHLTCSIGVAAYPQNADTRDGLIEMADQAMYVAKRLGRNQVRAAGDPAVAALGAETGQHGSREEATLAGTVEALAALVEARDHGTGQHAQDVASLAARLALELGLDTSEAHMVGVAGRLHDIGKVAVPDAVLNKPHRLTDEEWVLVRKHAAVGAAVVSRIPKLCVLAPVIRAHHEFWNGEGYPDGLAGEVIPLSARILAVADAYQAMTSDRPYCPAATSDRALAELDRCAGTQFDPEVVDALRQVLRLGMGEGVA